MAINSRESLKDFCFRALGAPLVEIDITPEAMEDVIESALEFFQEYYFDGADRFFYKHKVTQADIDNKYLTLPLNIWAVNGVFPMSNSGSNQASIFDFEYQLRSSDVMRNIGSTGLVYYTQVMQNLSMADSILNVQRQFQYNRNTDRLFISMNWEQRLSIDSWILLDCYAVIDPAANSKFWNNREFKEYCVAKVKKQWSMAYKKYSQITLPGGISIDGQSLYQEAVQEIEDIETNIINNQSPLGFMVG